MLWEQGCSLILWGAPGGHQARGETGLLAGVGQGERAEGSRAPAQGDGPPSLPGLSCTTKMVQTWMALRRAAFLCEQFAECSPVTRGPENKQRSLLFLVFNSLCSGSRTETSPWPCSRLHAEHRCGGGGKEPWGCRGPRGGGLT